MGAVQGQAEADEFTRGWGVWRGGIATISRDGERGDSKRSDVVRSHLTFCFRLGPISRNQPGFFEVRNVLFMGDHGGLIGIAPGSLTELRHKEVF